MFCNDVGIPYALYGFVERNKQVVGHLDEVSGQGAILAKCQRTLAKRGREIYEVLHHHRHRHCSMARGRADGGVEGESVFKAVLILQYQARPNQPPNQPAGKLGMAKKREGVFTHSHIRAPAKSIEQ